MNLNEICLLNFLKNPNELNNLSILLGEFCIAKAEQENNEAKLQAQN